MIGDYVITPSPILIEPFSHSCIYIGERVQRINLILAHILDLHTGVQVKHKIKCG